jgi:hypothetical protein
VTARISGTSLRRWSHCRRSTTRGITIPIMRFCVLSTRMRNERNAVIEENPQGGIPFAEPGQIERVGPERELHQ